MPQTVTLDALLAAAPGDKQVIAAALEEARQRTWLLARGLSEEHWHAPACDYLSPPAWDLGHMANFEEQWLVQRLGGSGESRPGANDTYDAFAHPRPERPSLPLLDQAAVRSYMDDVRTRALSILQALDMAADRLTADGFVHWMLVLHEHQHQETILQTMQMRSGACIPPPQRPLPSPSKVLPQTWLDVPPGPTWIGAAPGPGVYDNEAPLHEVDVPAFQIARYPVTCGEYLRFVEAGGYEDRSLWDARGWQWVRQGNEAPLYWHRLEGRWHRRGLSGTRPVEEVADEILCHVSWFEAQAFARWAGARLPTETEWEKACLHVGTADAKSGGTADARSGGTADARSGGGANARWGGGAEARWGRTPWGAPAQPTRANVDQLGLMPSRAGAYPDGASPCGAQHMIGDVWEWTASDWQPYPGFAAFPYAEYSEVFFGGDYRVLRGGSWASRAGCATGTFRNWDHPYRRQIFAGIRLART